MQNSYHDEYLSHFGVKGMKWGVRKTYKEVRNRPLKTMTLKAKNGDTVVVQEDRTQPFPAFMSAISPRFRKRFEKSTSFTMKVDGKLVGEAAFDKRDNGELYFNWMGVDPEHRGKGYASVVFKAAVEYARASGCKTISLEVPGNAPDARHIYEKNGFVDRGKVSSDKDLWGGLTKMTLDVRKGA